MSPTGVAGDIANLHQDLDRLSKSGDGLAGFLEGPNVFHTFLAVPHLLANSACRMKSATCCWLCWQPINLCRPSFSQGLNNTCQQTPSAKGGVVETYSGRET